MTTTGQAWPLHPQRGVHNQTARTPRRRPGSVRRTTALDFLWGEDLLGPCTLSATGRDLLTRSDGTTVLGSATIRATLTPPAAVVTALELDAAHLDAGALLGLSVSTGFRRGLQRAVPADRRAGLHYRLLHDLPGATMVSQSVPIHAGHKLFEPRELMVLADVCQGWRSGAHQMNEVRAGRAPQPYGPEPGDLDDGTDPLAWHAVELPPGDTFRRGRRIDVWRAGDELRIDLHYRDVYRPATRPAMVIHEYSVRGRAEAESLQIREMTTEAHALPWSDCNSVVTSTDGLVGVRLGECDTTVRTRLAGTAGCTHLNDSLRELDEVPALAAALHQRIGR